jgi:hypothetical protein
MALPFWPSDVRRPAGNHQARVRHPAHGVRQDLDPFVRPGDAGEHHRRAGKAKGAAGAGPVYSGWIEKLHVCAMGIKVPPNRF